jgi:hypothetical protein
MTEAVNTSEMSVNFYETARRNIPADSHLRTLRRENLKSHQEHSKLLSARIQLFKRALPPLSTSPISNLSVKKVEVNSAWLLAYVRVEKSVLLLRSLMVLCSFLGLETDWATWLISSDLTGKRSDHILPNSLFIQFHPLVEGALLYNSIHLFTCLTTARQGQLQPSTKTTVQDKI